MSLAELLSPERIIPDMRATEHWPAMMELVDGLIASGSIRPESRDSILEAIRQREDQCSTGIGGGKAIPHIYSEEVSEVTAIFGRSKTGIEFGALDNAPVFFIILLIVPKEQYNLHLRTLAAIARDLSDGEMCLKLSEAADANEMIEILGRNSKAA